MKSNCEIIIGVVYCYTNIINGKKYIGQTINESHRKSTFKSVNLNYAGVKIDNARRKYDINNFEYKVLSRKIYLNEVDARFDMDLLETYYISIFDSYYNGYNSTFGADKNVKGFKHSEETKLKIKNAMLGENNPFYGKHHSEEAKNKNRIAHKNRKPTEEARKKMSESRKGKKMSDETKQKLSMTKKMLYPKGETHYNFGRKLTDEQKRKISESKRGKRRIKSEKKIFQIDLQTGEIIKEWDSISQASKALGLNAPNIVNVCKGKYKHSGGFGWKYKLSI